MKRLLCCLLGIALLLSLLTGCKEGETAPQKEGGADKLSGFLIGSSNEDYLLAKNAELDLTEAHISSDRTVFLQEGVTLKLVGALTPGEGNITVRAENESQKKPVLDLSEMSLADIEPQEVTLFEIRSDVELIPPAETKTLVVDRSNEEWTSVKSVIPPKEEPQDEPQDGGPQDDNGISTPEELLQAFGDSGADSIELNEDITVELKAASLARDLSVTCNGHALTLSGKLNMTGGVLNIGEKPGVESGTADLSGLAVTCDSGVYKADGSAILFIGLNSKYIIGEPTLAEDLIFEIPDSGEHATVELREAITPEQNEAKLQEEMTQYLSGVDFPGGVGISAKLLADGVLEIKLDNPTVAKEIGVGIDGGMKLILTGSVTFDGGNYGFELNDGSSGTATVDITGLKIHGTKALGSTKSKDIFKITGDNVDFIFNESDPHIEVVVNDQFWLRYVQ